MATVIIGVAPFRTRLLAMSLPRLVITPHLMGRPLGRPGDAATQRAVLETALTLLETASGPGSVVDFDPGQSEGRPPAGTPA